MDFLLLYFDRIGQKYYHARLMSARAVIDSLEFARGSQQLDGEVQIAQLTRLADSLFNDVGALKYQLMGGCDARQRPRLQLVVAGSINLRCQRCLGSLPFPVAAAASLLVLTDKAGGATAELDDLDGVPADPHTDVWGLIEDEVLLALPLSPRHGDGLCSAAVDTSRDRAASPFAVLAKLKQDRMQN
jgi:uncharacterized protein